MVSEHGELIDLRDKLEALREESDRLRGELNDALIKLKVLQRKIERENRAGDAS
jgi:hypothetical protein